MSHPKLKYFAITALAEPIRFLFAYGNIEYDDVRYNKNDWPKVKQDMPFGQMPILEIDGKVINQSLAIARYLAKKVKLAGKDDWQALQVDSAVENINDLRAKIAAYFYEPDAQKKANNLKVLKEESLPFFLSRLEAMVKQNEGYFVDGELTWADLYFAALQDYFNHMYGSDVLAGYPILKKLCADVYAVPAIKTWIAKRPANNM